MVLAALPTIGMAALGGIEGYRKSGGNLGSALLGAGLGAAGGAGLGALGGAATRMAGQALAPFAGSALSATNAAKAIPLVGKLIPSNLNIAQQVALGNKITQAAGALPAVAGTAAMGLGGLAVPAVAGSISGAVGRGAQAAQPLAGQAAQTALGYGAYRQTPADYGANLPYAYDQTIGQYGGITPSGLPSEVLGPIGLGKSLETQRQAQASAEALRILKPIEMGYIDAMRRRDFTRQAAMKGIAQNIATQANMLQNAQLAAMNLGQTTGEGISRALGQVTQYA